MGRPDEPPFENDPDFEREPDFESDADMQALLAEMLEALDRGESIDGDRLRREQPRYAGPILEFLETSGKLRSLFRVSLDDTSATANQVTVDLSASDTTRPRVSGADGRPEPHGSKNSGSTWSLGRLRRAEFPVAFGDYSLLAEIDRGGMGIVFKAEHRRLKRIVALKVLRAGELSGDEELARFRVEAEACASLNHPNIVSVFEVGEVRGLTYFTMPYIDGESLASVARRGELGFKESVRVVARIAAAVGFAHRHGIIHRDLKPSNILIDEEGEPQLIDFGLAKGPRTERGLTFTGQILGTPAYMAPEQARGETMTPLCDVYSLGAVLYELVAGQPAFSGPTPVDVLLQVLNVDPPSLRKVNPKAPRPLVSIVSRSMAKEPEERYGTATELEEDLRRFLLDEPIECPKPTWLERANLWWRREPVLVSHLAGILAVLLIVLVAMGIRPGATDHRGWILGLLTGWAVGSYALQRVSVIDRHQAAAFWGWAAFDVVIYTTLIYLAEPPRGLLMIGYPMMIAASGLWYRTRFVVFVTAMCIAGFLLLVAGVEFGAVEDSLTEMPEFCVIYLAGLIVLALCVVAMIRRVRGLADYFSDHP